MSQRLEIVRTALEKVKKILDPIVGAAQERCRATIERAIGRFLPSEAKQAAFGGAIDRARVELMKEHIMPRITKLRDENGILYTGESIDGQLSSQKKDLFEREVLFRGILDVRPDQTIEKLEINIVKLCEKEGVKTIRATFSIYTDGDQQEYKSGLHDFDIDEIVAKPRP